MGGFNIKEMEDAFLMILKLEDLRTLVAFSFLPIEGYEFRKSILIKE